MVPLQEVVPLQWVEFFAGKAEATRMFKENGFQTARLDINYMTEDGNKMNPMNLLTDAGFGFLANYIGIDNVFHPFCIPKLTTYFGDLLGSLGLMLK